MGKVIVGRVDEQKVLDEIYSSGHAHYVAITGRRRVGKTYLVKTYFGQRLDFDFSGMPNATLKQQLQNFHYCLSVHFRLKKKDEEPQSWLEAFQMLSRYLDAKKKKGKLAVFIDELPWLDTHKSGFIAALDWFWNSWAVNKNIVLLVCSSATSWMISKLINNKGGLHNRITKRIHLAPFTLHETEQFLKHYGVKLSRYHILQLYMALGGIPHYLKEVRKGESAIQAINRICFQKTGLLVNEFDNLYKALFKNSEQHIRIIFALASKQKGLTRNEILSITKMKDGGTFTKILEELDWCNFIMPQQPFGQVKKETLYRLADEYSLFYIKFIHKKKNVNWQQLSSTQTWKSWSGYAFESICMKHIQQVKNALGIGAVYTESAGFVQKAANGISGTQIDLLIDRSDNVINICEAKFYDKPFVLTKTYAEQFRNKLNIFRQASGTSKTLFPTVISTHGIVANQHSIGFIEQEVTMDNLFAS